MRVGSMSQAIAAYSSAAARRPDPPAASAGGATDFGTVLRREIAGTVEGIRRGEAASVAGVTGGASIQEVVEAVSQAELGLQKLAAVRDRAIAAYQEILRMPI